MRVRTSESAPIVSLLIISDSHAHLKKLQSALSGSSVEITEAYSMQEIADACGSNHDLAVVDVGPTKLPEVLRTLRSSQGNVDASVLVPSDRSSSEPKLAGVLARYRAMPCSSVEMQKLVRSRTESTPKRARRGLL